MISRQAVLHEDVAPQRHRLGERPCRAEVVIAHQVAFVIIGPGEPVVFQRRVLAADVEVLALGAVVHVAVAHRQVTAIDVDVVRGRGQRSVRVAVGVELAELHSRLAALRAAGQAVVVEGEHAVFDVKVSRAVVIPDAGGIEGRRAAVAEDNARDAVILRAAELPAAAPAIPGGVTSRRVLYQVRSEVPDRRVGRIERRDDDRVGGRLLGQINAECIRARRNQYLIAGIGAFDLRVVIVGGNVDDGRFGTAQA